MYNISELSNDEIKYICERMHLPAVRYYFQKNPKEFNKLRPGFTVKKMTDDETLSFLIKYANKPFIQSVIQGAVKQWLSEIKEHRDSLEHEGFTAGEALLKTIPECVFCDRIELYFKLIEQAYTDDYLRLLNDALSLVKKTSDIAQEEYNIELQNTEIEKLNSEITTIRQQLDKEKEHGDALQHELDGVNEQLQENQCLLSDTTNKLRIAESTISDMKHELEHYQALERYAGNEVSPSHVSNYQYVSIGQILYDYNDQRWIFRLADITESGEIVPFVADETIPHYFSNRDRLYWRNGPDTDQAIGVWNWNVTPRDTDPNKDYVETDFCNNIQLTQIIQLLNCETLDDVVSLLKNGISFQFSFNKLLFVYEENTILTGLLCSSSDFDRANDKIALKSDVYTLPQYSIKLSDTMELAGIRIYKFLSLGIPQSIYQVRDPYEAVKSLIISRFTNANLREYGLSKKEVQHCRNYLTAIPTQDIIQELTLAYNCSNETAQEYIDGFISLADQYLSASDIDTTIISRAIQGNTELLDLCKQQLADEWKSENEKQLAKAESKLSEVLGAVEKNQNEIEQLAVERDKLADEMEQLQSALSQREQLASDVETKISTQIEKAKQNVADFISNMAFVSPLYSAVTSNGNQLSNQLSVFNSHIDCVEDGEIDDVDTFEDELSENLTRIGYDNEQSIEISQAISFGVFEKVPLVISENAKLIAQCLAAVLNGGNVSEVFVPVQGISIEELSAVINDNVSKASPMVCLVHGVFDGYSINLFNALSNIMQNWDNAIILLSIEGTQSKMIMPGVWNRSIYIDGDRGFEKKTVDLLHTFTVLDSLDLHDRTIDMKSKEYKDARKSMKLFTDILSNTQIGMYSRYLAIYNASLDDSNLILTQLIATARSTGNPERLKELLQENGIGSCEELFD
ncbi:MAG TPA: hypothetical protein PLS20_02855 [Ruminococcus flavefaciens]|nr:hypothetical protein [Ruminococcus flavefaciens]